MEGLSGRASGAWIPTERTHPFYIIQVVGTIPVVAVVLTYLFFKVLVPQAGLEVAIVLLVVIVAFLAAGNVWTWSLFRPTAIRTTNSGIEIKRRFAAVYLVPREKLALLSRPRGFGYLSHAGGSGFLLSPNQFAAAKRAFPVPEPREQRAASPLP